jgi:hypothetical protein
MWRERTNFEKLPASCAHLQKQFSNRWVRFCSSTWSYCCCCNRAKGASESARGAHKNIDFCTADTWLGCLILVFSDAFSARRVFALSVMILGSLPLFTFNPWSTLSFRSLSLLCCHFPAPGPYLQNVFHSQINHFILIWDRFILPPPPRPEREKTNPFLLFLFASEWKVLLGSQNKGATLQADSGIFSKRQNVRARVIPSCVCVCGCTWANKEIASANTEPLAGARREKIPRWQMNDADRTTHRPAKHEKRLPCVAFILRYTHKKRFLFQIPTYFCANTARQRALL